MGHDQHLLVAGQAGERAADGDGRLAADAGVDLVEDQGGRRRGEHQAQGQHDAGQLAARGHLGQRQGRRARVGGEQHLDLVAGVVVGHRHLDPGVGHGQLGQVRLHPLGQRRGRGPAGGAHHRGLLLLLGAGGGQQAVELGGPAVVVLQLGQAGAEALALGQHVGERVAVLAAQVVEQLAPLADQGQALRVLLDQLGRDAQLGRGVGQLGGQGAEPLLVGLERAAPAEGGDGHAQRVGRRPFAGEGLERQRRGLAVGGGVGQRVLLGPQRLVLVGAGDGGVVDLGHLVAHEVELACPVALVAPEARQLVAKPGDLLAGGQQRLEVDPAEPVERLALGRGVQQRLVGVLAVEVDQLDAQLGHDPGGGQAAVDVGPAAPVAGHRPGHDHLAVAVDEAALDPGLVGPGAHQRGVGPAADQQLDGVDHHRLAGAGLAGHGGHARGRAAGAARR